MGKLLNEMGNCPFASPLIAPLAVMKRSIAQGFRNSKLENKKHKYG